MLRRTYSLVLLLFTLVEVSKNTNRLASQQLFNAEGEGGASALGRLLAILWKNALT